MTKACMLAVLCAFVGGMAILTTVILRPGIYTVLGAILIGLAVYLATAPELGIRRY